MMTRPRNTIVTLLLLAPSLALLGSAAPAPVSAQSGTNASAPAATPAPVAARAPGHSGPPVMAARHFPDDEDLRVMLRYLVEDGETPGIVLGLLEADGSTRILHHGDAGPDALPLAARSVFELGSITKAFTGILLADMVERGEVSLSDPISRYMPEGVTIPSRGGREITLLDIATHRSSLPRMPDDMASEDGETYPEYTMEDLHAFVSRHELRREIGSDYEYSNIAVALLGDALARAAGKSYEALLRERILDPLGMDMTSTVVDGEIRRWMTRGHSDGGDPAPYRNWPDMPAMGALRSTAEDMLTFLAANVGEPDSPLDRAMRSAYEPRAEIGDGVEVALAWQVRTIGDRTIVTHGGATAGYSTRVAFDPGLGVGIVRLANTNDFDDDLGMDVLIRGRPLDIPEVDVPVAALEPLAGRYEIAPGNAAVVRLEPEGYLTFQTPGNVRFRMYAESDTSYFLKRTPWRLRFTRGENGVVEGLVADVNGSERRARRVAGEVPPPTLLAGNLLDVTLSIDEMATYVGTYGVDVDGEVLDLRVLVEGDRLMGRLRADNPSRLMYQGDDTFAPVVEPSTRVVFTVEDGRARAVEVRQEDAVYRGARKEGG